MPKIIVQLLHDFAGKGMLNVLGGDLPKWYLPFQSYDSVALTLGCKLASFYHILPLTWKAEKSNKSKSGS